VRTSQRKPRELRVVELCALPLIHAVAGLACYGQVSGHVIHRARLLKIVPVAGDARRAQSDKLPARGSAVAIVALKRGMGADQREAVQVAANRIHIRTPAVDRMAILTPGAELPAMDICVAISALLTNVSKNFSHMAGITCDILVHAAQRISGFAIVVKFDSLPNG
jgi:hypothetical protein